MSYTIQSTPATLSSVHDDLIYTVAYPEHTGDPVTYSNYKFVADIYISGVLRARLKKVPHPETSIGIFNIGQVVRNYIAPSFNPSADAVIAQTLGTGEFKIAVQVKFGEEYAFDTYTNLVVDSERIFYNNYNGRLIGTTTTLNGLSDKAATTRPLTTPIRCDSSFNFIPFFGVTVQTNTLEVKTYDYGNNLVETFDLSVVVDEANTLLILNISKDGINGIRPDSITDIIKYFTVEINGILYRFNISCDCKYENFTLHFLNKYGGFESKEFGKVSRKTINIERKDFNKLPYTVDVSGVVNYYNSNNVYNETASVYSSQFKERLTLNSDFLSDGEYTWLQELIVSPMIYLEQNGYFVPVRITDNDYEPKKNINDQLTNLTLSVEFGQTYNAQYR